MISLSADLAAARASSGSTRMKLCSCPSSFSMRASRLSVSSTGDNSFFAMRRAASAMVRKSGTIVLFLRKGGGMGRFGADGARLFDKPRHLLVKRRRRKDFGALLFRHVQPQTGQRRIEFLSGHACLLFCERSEQRFTTETRRARRWP